MSLLRNFRRLLNPKRYEIHNTRFISFFRCLLTL
jgi:hypothetical protein